MLWHLGTGLWHRGCSSVYGRALGVCRKARESNIDDGCTPTVLCGRTSATLRPFESMIVTRKAWCERRRTESPRNHHALHGKLACSANSPAVKLNQTSTGQSITTHIIMTSQFRSQWHTSQYLQVLPVLQLRPSAPIPPA
jgi:hypothetical protein